MADTSDIRKGLCIDYNNGIYAVVEFQHVKPGKGAAFVRTKLKNVTDGRVIENNFPSGHKLDVVRVERQRFQFLYPDETGYNFMNNESFEQVTINGDMLERPELLKEGTEVDILFHAEKEIPLTIEMPQYVILKVTYTEPGLKGDTATNTYKPATVETNAEVKVPLFINEGDLIKIDTSTGAYMERVKQ
ncbi:MAG: elongation factor P [Saprospiraceae bacterium]|nr:elongation factor P [Saprospiraceae bacterium]